MNYNILDQIIDEDNYGPNSAEWRLRGLSAEGQRNLIHDTGKRLARRAKNAGVNFSADEYEKKMLNMPETFQDAMLYTHLKAPIKFKNVPFFENARASNYDPEKHSISVNANFMRDGDTENSLLHESSHWFDFGNGNNPKVRDTFDRDLYFRLSNLGKMNLGETLRKELLDAKNIKGKNISPYEYLDNVVSNYNDRFSDVFGLVSEGKRSDLNNYLSLTLDDMYRLHPKTYGGGGSHGRAYKTRNQNIARMAGFDEDVALNYPLSVESVANIVPALGYEGGEKVFRTYAPETFGMIENSFANHKGLKSFVPPKRKYADEEGLRLIDERERKNAERQAKVNERYNAKFMTLPEDKRAYYESAEPGSVLWMRDPNLYDTENGGKYFIIKGDGRFVGDKVLKLKPGYSKKFEKHNTYSVDLNQLSPEDAYAVPNWFDYEISMDEANTFKKRKNIK